LAKLNIRPTLLSILIWLCDQLLKWTTKCHLQDDGNIISFSCDQDEQRNWGECKNVQGIKGKHSQDSQVELPCWELES